MSYTVNKLAKLSGVSVRTLHFYDEIGLLEPAYVGENNYRYYEEKQLLMLQQILFYRELGFPLSEIQKILVSESFDTIGALTSHRKILERNLDRTQDLIKTIDKTIAHLRGGATMKDEELYYGFDSTRQKEHEQYLIDAGIVTQEFMDESREKVKDWNDDQKNEFIREIETVMKGLVEAVENGLSPSSAEVQDFMRAHFIWLKRSWHPTKEKYLDLISMYHTPDFRKFFDQRHPQLLEFISKAMRVFADKELS